MQKRMQLGSSHLSSHKAPISALSRHLQTHGDRHGEFDHHGRLVCFLLAGSTCLGFQNSAVRADVKANIAGVVSGIWL
jgi:hypothetical protein